MNFWRDNFTDYDDRTWEMGAFFVGISLAALLIFQTIDIARGHVFNSLAFGGAVSAILGSFGLYKWGDSRGRIAAEQTGFVSQCDQRGEAGA